MEPTSCDKCELLKLKLKDANVKIAQLKDNFVLMRFFHALSVVKMINLRMIIVKIVLPF